MLSKSISQYTTPGAGPVSTWPGGGLGCSLRKAWTLVAVCNWLCPIALIAAVTARFELISPFVLMPGGMTSRNRRRLLALLPTDNERKNPVTRTANPTPASMPFFTLSLLLQWQLWVGSLVQAL